MDKLYSAYDCKAKSYSKPMYLPHHAAATRAMATAVNSDTEIAQYPEDFELYYIGEYDSDTGQHTNVIPEFIVAAISLIKMEKKNETSKK